MKIGDFFVSLGVKADTKVLTEFGQRTRSAFSNVMGLKTAVVAAGASFAYFANETFKSVQALENFNRATGLSINKLQQFQRVANLSGTGLDGSQVASQIQALQQNLTDLKFGGGNTQAFRLLGIDVSGKDSFQVLEDMRQAIKGLSDAEATNIIGKAGFSPEMLQILRMSNKEFEKMGKGSFMSAKGRKDVMEMGKAVAKITTIFKEWKDLLIALVAGPVGNFLKMIGDLMEALQWLAVGFYNIKPLFYGFAAGFAVMAAAASPMLAMFALLYLVIEDLWVAFKGGESLSGDAFNYLKEVFSGVAESFKEMWQYIKDISSSIAEWTMDAFLESITFVVDKFKEIWDWITTLSTSKIFKLLSEGFSSVMGWDGMVNGEAKKGAENVNNQNSNKTANQNNVYHINSTAPADDVANGIAKQTTRDLNYAHDEVG